MVAGSRSAARANDHTLARFQLVRRTKGSPEQSLCFEDLAGRYRFVDLPPGKVTVQAGFGSRFVEAELEGDALDIVIPAK